MKPRVAVYAAPSVDVVDGIERPGGPLFFVRMALEATGAGTAVAGWRGCRPARFLHRPGPGGGRESSLLEAPSCDWGLPDADAAVVSPIACELGVEEAGWLARAYPLAVLDLQGFMRSCSPGRILALRGVAGAAAGELLGRGFTLAKLSLEDLGFNLLEAPGMEGVVLTLGPRGLVARLREGCLYCRPLARAPGPGIGAGDMLLGLAAAALAEGKGAAEALCMAASGVACLLVGGGDCRRAYREATLAEAVLLDGGDCLGLAAAAAAEEG